MSMMRTPFKSRTRRTPTKHSTPNSGIAIDDGPVQEFSDFIERVSPEQWQQRTDAFQNLVDSIPEDFNGDDYLSSLNSHSPSKQYREQQDLVDSDYHTIYAGSWYSSAKILRHLVEPLSKLLKDGRSSVVKRIGQTMVELGYKCRSLLRYFLKDLMKTILDVHAQTVAIVRATVQTMTLELLPLVPCKATMPLMLERLKTDKSRTVRDACALYLTVAIDSWNSTSEGPAYLTPEIMTQVGTALIRSIRDPSPSVRDQAKQGVEVMRSKYYDVWESLVMDPSGPAAKDLRLKKLLMRTLDEPETALDDFSVASKGSLSTSRRSQKSAPNLRYGGGNSKQHSSSHSTKTSSRQQQTRTTPPPPTRRKAKNLLGSGSKSDHGIKSTPSSAFTSPPRRTTTTTTTNRPIGGVPSQVVVSSSKKKPKSSTGLSASLPHQGGRRLYGAGGSSGLGGGGGGGGLGPPQRMINTSTTTRPQQRQPRNEIEDDQEALGTIDRPSIGGRISSSEYSRVSSGTFDPGFLSPASTLTHTVRGEQDGLQFTFSAAEDDDQEEIDQAEGKMYIPADEEGVDSNGPFIGSFNELKRQAKNRRSRRSSILQERFRHNASCNGSTSSLLVSEPGGTGSAAEGGGGGAAPTKSITSMTETTQHQEDFSSAADEHLSIARQLLDAHRMHVDKIMETLRVEMDSMRDFEKKIMNDKELSEEEVLTYFESIGLCLDQRTSSGEILQDELDRIAGTTTGGGE